MDRATKFGMRALRIQGGHIEPVIIVRNQVSGGDLSRGVRGTVSSNETEVQPRPTVTRAKANDVTRLGSKLQIGDAIIEMLSTQINEADLQDTNFRIRLGYPPSGELLRVVDYDQQTLAGSIITYRVYARGVVNT